MIPNIYIQQVRYVVICAFSLCMIIMPQLSLFSTGQNFYDLGLYSNLMFNSAELNKEISRGHIQPILYFFSEIYNAIDVRYSVSLILLIQSFFIIASALLLNYYYGILSTLVYILAPSIWYLGVNGFHFEFISIISTVAFFIFAKQNKIFAAIVSTVFITMSKEYYALFSIGLLCYLYLPVSRLEARRSLYLSTTLIFIVLNVVYFLISLKLLNSGPISNTGFDNSIAYSWMGIGIGNKISYVLHHKLEFLGQLFSLRNFYFVSVLASFSAFLCLLSPKFYTCILILFLYFLSKLDNYTTITSHYAALFVVPISVSYQDVLERISFSHKKIFVIFTLIFIYLVHFFCSPSPFSFNFYSHRFSQYHYSHYVPIDLNYDNISKLNSFFCDNNRAYVITQNNIMTACIVNRTDVDVFPEAVDYASRNIYRKAKTPDFVVIDRSRRPYMLDKTCTFRFGKCTDSDFDERYMDSTSKLFKDCALDRTFGNILVFNNCQFGHSN